MQRRFYHSLQTIDGLIQYGKRDAIRLEDLDGVRPPEGTAAEHPLGTIRVNEYGQVIRVVSLAAGTYYSLTVGADHTLTGSTTPPSSGGVTRLVTVTATVGNVGSGADILTTTNLTAGILGSDGDVIEGILGGAYADNVGPDYRLILYFGTIATPTAFYTSDPKGASGSVHYWTIRFTIIRVSSSVVRVTTTYTDDITATETYDSVYTEITGLTLGNSMELTLTGESASTPADNDITLTMGYVEKHAAS